MIRTGTRGTLAFGCMILNSALLLLIRSVSTSFLMLVGPVYLWCYFGGDLALFFAQKIARGDFHHWMSVADGPGGFIFFDCICQSLHKITVDYTAMLQLRLVGALGGAYYSASLGLAITASIAATKLYFILGEDLAMDEATAWAIVGGLSVAYIVNFAAFLLFIEHKYVPTERAYTGAD